MAQVTTFELTHQINEIKDNNPEEHFFEACGVFLKLITNIITSPNEQKFRVIKKTNKIIAEKWASCTGMIELAQAVGYEKVDETLLTFVGEVENLVVLKEIIETAIQNDRKKTQSNLNLTEKSNQSSQVFDEKKTESIVSSEKNIVVDQSDHKKKPEKHTEDKKEIENHQKKLSQVVSMPKAEINSKPADKPQPNKNSDIKPINHEKEPDSKLEWSGSSYTGPIKDGWFEGKGRFTFPSGVISEGDFHKGEFHGKGTLIFPNGGKYKASWERGRAVDGEYEYYDGLIYDSQNWNYCQIPDRRFYTEIKEGLRPAGATLIVNNPNGPKATVPGTYDVGDGYYNMGKNMLYNYDYQEVGPPEDADLREILDKYRYNPSI